MCGACAAVVQAGVQVGGGEQVAPGAGSRVRMQVRWEHRAQGWPGAVSHYHANGPPTLPWFAMSMPEYVPVASRMDH